MKNEMIIHSDHVEIRITYGPHNVYVYTFNTKDQADIFFQGFRCALSVANSMVQSVPHGYDIKKGNVDQRPA